MEMDWKAGIEPEMKVEMDRKWKRKSAGYEIGNGKAMKYGNIVRGLAAEARFWYIFVPLK